VRGSEKNFLKFFEDGKIDPLVIFVCVVRVEGTMIHSPLYQKMEKVFSIFLIV
jgi:hypothetical protein